jgi:glycosyltransferase involved in cell wall biosynthesis
MSERLGLDGGAPWLVAVAMMRAGDKLASYRILGEALARSERKPWQLLVVGDGPARGAVEEALGPVSGRVRYLGSLPEPAVFETLAAADLFVWPAINEAFGMALLEAQAAGLPVVAGRTGGVPDVVADGATGLLPPVGDAAAFAAAIAALLDDSGRRRALGAAARQRVVAEHSLAGASLALEGALAGLRGKVRSG